MNQSTKNRTLDLKFLMCFSIFSRFLAFFQTIFNGFVASLLLFLEVDTDNLYDPSVIQSYLQLMMETSNLDALTVISGSFWSFFSGTPPHAQLTCDPHSLGKMNQHQSR